MKEKVQFTEDVIVLKGDNKTIDFQAKAGEVVELSTASARHWYSRNKAIPHIQGKAKTKPVAPKTTEVKEPEVAPTPKKSEAPAAALKTESGKDKA